MPPKKKKTVVRGQLKLSFVQNSSTVVDTTETEEEDEGSHETGGDCQTNHRDQTGQTTTRRGNVDNWRAFGDSKWRRIYPWVMLKDDGVYCQFCSHSRSEVRSRSGVFVSKPFQGNRPDKLGRHAQCSSHLQNKLSFQEFQNRVATQSTVSQMIQRSDVLTIDEEAFCDALRCMYWLNKNEIAHTTNFAGLKELCILLGNETLPALRKSGNTNYGSEQIMGEMVDSIGSTLEQEILLEVRDSPFFSIVLDEATDIAVKKQLGICVHYLDVNGTVQVRNLKLLEVNQGTADVITDTIVTYLTSLAPVTLDINKLAGGASVMVGWRLGLSQESRERSQLSLLHTAVLIVYHLLFVMQVMLLH